MDVSSIDQVNLNDLDITSFRSLTNTVAGERAIVRSLLERVRIRKDYAAAKAPRGLGGALHIWIQDTFYEDCFRDKAHGYTDMKINWPLLAHWVFMGLYPDHARYREFANTIHRRFAIDKYLAEADKAAGSSKCQKLHVGAVLVRAGKIVSKGWNGHPKNTRLDDVCDRMGIEHSTKYDRGFCIHAEHNLIVRANPTQLRNGFVYLTHSPCVNCTKALIQAEVPLVIFRVGQYATPGPELAWRLGGKTRFYGV